MHNATIKRMLDNSVVFSSPAGASGTSPAAAAVAAVAAGSSPASAAGQEQHGSPAQGFAKRGPPPGFGPAPQHCKGMQQEEPVLSAPAGLSAACAEVPTTSQPAPGYIACGNQVPPAPLQPLPLRQPSFNQRLPPDGAPWQSTSPVGIMDSPQQAAFFAACSSPVSAFGVLQPQQQLPQQQQGVPPPWPPPYEPPPCAAFAGPPVGFDGLPAGFSPMQGPPPAAGYMTWQQQQHQQHLQQQQYWQLPPADVIGLFQLQHLAAQRKQQQAAHPAPPAALNPPFPKGFGPGQCRPPPGSPASPAPRAYAPPPPPRPPLQAHPGMNMHAPNRFMAPQHGGFPGPHQHAGYAAAGYPQPAAGPAGMAGRVPAYTGFGPRASSGPPQAHAGHGAPGFGERRSSNAASCGTDVHPVIAALPRSASALWEPSSSPTASTSNLRKSNSYDGVSRLGTEVAAATLPGTLLAVAGAAVLAVSGRLRAGGGAPGAPSASGNRHSVKAGAPGVSTGRRSSSDGGSFISAMGRASSRGLAWDPLSGISSGGGAQPPLGGDAGGLRDTADAASTARQHGKARAVAAKMPLVYTPAAMADLDDTWTSGTTEGPSGGARITFSMSQLGPADMEVMFRKLRVGVRGPDARPI